MTPLGRIVTVLVVSSILGLTLLSSYLGTSLQSSSIDQWVEHKKRTLRFVAKQIDEELIQARSRLEYLAKLNSFKAAPNPELINLSINGIPLEADVERRKALSWLLDEREHGFSVLFVLLPNGDHYLSHPYSIQTSLKSYNLSHRPYFQTAKATKSLIVSDSFIGADGVPAVAMALPILDDSESIHSYLGGVFYLSQLSELIHAQSIISQGETSFLLDRSGRLIAYSGQQSMGDWSPQSIPEIKQFIDKTISNKGQQDYGIHSIHIPLSEMNQDQTALLTRLKSGWVLGTTRATSSIDKEFQTDILQTTGLAAVLLLLISMFSIGVTRWIGRRWQVAEGQVEDARQNLEVRVKQRTQELEKQQHFLHLLTNTIPDLVWMKDLEGRYLFCNARFERLFGAKEQNIIGKTDYDFVEKELADLFFENDKLAIFSTEINVNEEEIIYADDGHKELLETKKTAIKDSFGEIIGVLGIARDITERRKHENNLIESELWFKAITGQSTEGITVADLEGNYTYVNQAFCNMVGYSEAELLNMSVFDVKAAKQCHSSFDRTKFSEEQQIVDVLLQRKDGSIFVSEVIGKVIEINGQSHVLGTIRDVTESKKQEETILHQAHFDSLTDLPNRFLSLDRLTQLINEANRVQGKVAVLFIDLDDFKKVNDTLGHETGDRLLIQTAARLGLTIRHGDTVGRLGGDEFIILLGNIKQESEAQLVAEKILECFRAPFKIEGRELVLSASIGISIYPSDGADSSKLLRNADSAMYHSKDLGRNTYSYFTEEMNHSVSRRLSVEEQIHGAMERNEFTVHFQPKVDIETGNISGAEALLRWSNPVLGNISPDEFIPIAEQNGLIIPLGEYVLHQSLENTAQWNKEFNLDLKIAVNLSPRQFRSPDLVMMIEKAISDYQLNSGNLELEITEGVLMSGHSYIDTALARIHELGIGIAMDDFGTGYSSLSYLRSYPFDVLKIDRSFVSDITKDSADRALIKATIAMAHGLKLKVVAEGVETEEQLVFLKNLNCDYAQGYLFSKPLCIDDMREYLASQ